MVVEKYSLMMLPSRRDDPRMGLDGSLSRKLQSVDGSGSSQGSLRQSEGRVILGWSRSRLSTPVHGQSKTHTDGSSQISRLRSSFIQGGRPSERYASKMVWTVFVSIHPWEVQSKICAFNCMVSSIYVYDVRIHRITSFLLSPPPLGTEG